LQGAIYSVALSSVFHVFLIREVDDEDEMLYGETEVPLFEPPTIPEPSKSTVTSVIVETPW
jgi:hypothetical protein